MRTFRKMRLSGDIESPNPNICFCSSDPPPPDPLIGQSAAANAEIGQQQVDLAKQQLAWNQTRAAAQDPLIAKIAQQQITSANTNTARADDQWNQYKTMFQPVENQMVTDAENFDSPERQAQQAAQAGADVTTAYGGALASNQRNMERMGVNPNSGKFAAINNETNLQQAQDTAGAMNTARNNTITQGMALRQGAAQFGRNMPNTGLAADSLALNGGNAAVGNMATGAGINNAGVNTANSLFGGASNSTSAAGQIGLGLYGNQLNAWNQQNQNNLGMMQGIGSLVGTLGGAGMLATKMRKGGVIKNNRAYGLNTMPYVSRNGRKPRIKGYAEGGIIESPDDLGPDYGFGLRQDGTNKGLGWLGLHKSVNGNVMSEYTVGVPVNGKQMDIPTFVPGLTEEELEYLKTEPDIRERSPMNDAIVDKARAHATKMVNQGKSVFAPPEQKGYRRGGMIKGPGTSTSDSVPAMIEGKNPVALSNGEAVLNAEAVQLVGEPFIHNINAAGLAMLSKNGGAQ